MLIAPTRRPNSRGPGRFQMTVIEITIAATEQLTEKARRDRGFITFDISLFSTTSIVRQSTDSTRAAVFVVLPHRYSRDSWWTFCSR